MAAYSFRDVSASLNGPSGSFQLAEGAGAAAEGITVEQNADANTVLIGAGGQGMHSQSLNTSSKITVRLLKTSPVNAQLMNAYNAQRTNTAQYGQNSITVRSVYQGDLVTCSEVAFAKVPKLDYAAEGGTNEWTFDALRTTYVLGTGVPDAN